MNPTPLMQAFDRARQGIPSHLASAMDALPAVGELPSPWATWTLIELVRYRRRQTWAREAIHESDLWRVASIEENRDEEDILEGTLPGSPRWEYQIETGCGPLFCHLTDRVNGEEISVELDADEGGEGHFIITDILSHWARQQREGSPARMLQLHPVINSVLYARTDLLELG
jgi:hypothetical protein